MGYGNAYRGRGGYRSSRPVTVGRIDKPNKRPGECRACKLEVPAGAGNLWREADGSWSVVHVPEHRGGWLMHPEPLRGGCPDDTDKTNAESHARGFFGPGAPMPRSEHDRIKATAERWAAANPTPARVSEYRRVTGRCEDAPCCGCCDV